MNLKPVPDKEKISKHLLLVAGVVVRPMDEKVPKNQTEAEKGCLLVVTLAELELWVQQN